MSETAHHSKQLEMAAWCPWHMKIHQELTGARQVIYGDPL